MVPLHPRLKDLRMEISASEVAPSQDLHSSHDLSTKWEPVFPFQDSLGCAVVREVLNGSG